MLKILLCDDDAFFLSLESEIVQKIIRDEYTAIDNPSSKNALRCIFAGMTKNAEEAISLIDKLSDCKILAFVDLDFGKNLPSGIDLSLMIRQLYSNVRIVFTTNHSEMAMRVLKSGVEPFGFLEKGTDIVSLSTGIARYIRMACFMADSSANDCDINSDNHCTIEINISGERVILPISDIVYIETEKNLSHGITYHTSGGSKITLIGSLDYEAERLGLKSSDFLRVHRSYLVNMNHALNLRDGDIVLSDMTLVPCSLKMRQEVRKWLQKN